MGLVTAKEVAKAINADKYGVFGTFSGWLLMKVLKISALNKLYDRHKHLKDVAVTKYINSKSSNEEIKLDCLNYRALLKYYRETFLKPSYLDTTLYSNNI